MVRFVSHRDHIAQLLMLADEEIRALDLDHVLPAPVAENAGHGLARGADHLRDLFVCEQPLEARAARRFVALFLAQSRMSRASFSLVVCDSPRERISRCAE